MELSAPSGCRRTDAAAGPQRLGIAAALLGLGVTAVIVALTAERGTWTELRRIDPVDLLSLAGLVVLAWCSSAGRLFFFLRALGHRLRLRRVFAIALAGELGVAATPAGVGGPALLGVVVLLWRLFTYHLYLAGGGLAFAALSLRRH